MGPSPQDLARRAATRKPSYSEDPYRSFAHFDADRSSLKIITREFETWLAGKRKWAVDLTVPGFREDDGRSLAVVHHSVGNIDLLRFRLTEDHPSTGIWTTDFAAGAPKAGGAGWFLLQVSNSRNSWVAVPRVAPGLVDVLPIQTQESLHLTPKPQRVSVHGVEDLAARVTDPERHGLIFIAGTDGELPFDQFYTQMGEWTRQVVGLAEVAVLDPLATTEFRAAMGDQHAVSPWTIRNFLPGADPATPDDHLRHRFLTIGKLVNLSDSALNQLLGRIARSHSITRKLPPEVLKYLRTLDRVENKYVIEGLAPTVESPWVTEIPTTSEVTRPAEPAVPKSVTPVDRVTHQSENDAQELLRLVMDVFEVEAIDRATLESIRARVSPVTDPAALHRTNQLLEQKQEQLDSLEDQIAELREKVDYWQLEYGVEFEERQRLSDESRWLRKELRAVQAFDIASSLTPTSEITAYPDSYIDLVDMISKMEGEGVVFTGDPKSCLELEPCDQLGASARIGWKAVLALRDYIRARNDGAWSGSVHDYLSRTPDGYQTLSAKKHAAGESSTTMQQWGHQRRFRVPENVASNGWIEMQAHFRLGQIGMVSPRMYYLDHWAKDGKIYIGYIGRHLKNTKTN
ncbi:cell division protein ZapB [Nocardia barduliensis]|uniref:cell division protein ZapB n=1 Tax=Nocardia barduliensis TaxID=2736643 RepID=UPI0015742272|nr:cell division protein ZapB [Nocardia barduliensis]